MAQTHLGLHYKNELMIPQLEGNIKHPDHGKKKLIAKQGIHLHRLILVWQGNLQLH